MKALTIWQPWATLLACGAKVYETRSWATNYRGPVALHAAKLDPVETLIKTFGVSSPEVDAIIHALVQAGYDLSHLPTGCVIATAELADCHPIVRHGGRGLTDTSPGWLELPDGIYEPTRQELLFGDWTPGRFAWEFQNRRVLDNPIPIKGGQRLWSWGGPSFTLD